MTVSHANTAATKLDQLRQASAFELVERVRETYEVGLPFGEASLARRWPGPGRIS
jgi:hypothetical protein